MVSPYGRLFCTYRSSGDSVDTQTPRIRGNKWTNSLPAAALGHFVMKVANLAASYQFYADLGLRQVGISFPTRAIIELRGGTHLLLVPENDKATSSLTSGRLGQRGAFFDEQLDVVDQLAKH